MINYSTSDADPQHNELLVDDIAHPAELVPEIHSDPLSIVGRSAKAIVNSYFEPKSFESEKLYEMVGIKTFKKYVPTFGDFVLKHLPGSIRMINGPAHDRLKGVRSYERFTRLYESIHIGGLATAGYFVNEHGVPTDTKAISEIIGINAIVNVYPIMLQRYNRIRLNKVNEKFIDR